MTNTDLSRTLVDGLAAAIGAGALDPHGPPGGQGGPARAWAAVEGRLSGDRLAAAALLLFASDPGSDDLRGRLARALAARIPADELRALLDTLGGGGDQAARSRTLAGEGAPVEGSGLQALAPDGAVDLETRAERGGRIIGSPTSPAPARRPLPATLSADGAHFSYGHALVVGVGQYRDPRLPAVPAAAADARALASLLRDPRLAAYPAPQVRVLLDGKATRANILDALEELALRVAGAEQSTALIFFAGHGEPTGGGYALLPYDADLADLEASGLGADLLHRRVAKVRALARRLVVLLNCCHAGGLGDGAPGAEDGALSGAAPPPEFYRPLAVESGQVVISSSRPGQKSGARSRRDPQHTTFGAHLLEALRGAAPGAGPAVGVFELFAHLRASVPADARGVTYRGAPLAQEPLFYASQLDDNIAVALRPPGEAPTVGAGADLAARLVALELRAEALGDALPDDLRAERDALLAQLERA